MVCYAFLFFTFLLNTVNIRGSTTPPVPELLNSTPTSGSTTLPVTELLTTQSTPEPTTTGQCQRPTLPDNVILKGDSYKDTYEKGFTANLECALGYTRATNSKRSIKCLGDRWTDTGFRCKKKSCGALPEIANGRYVYTEGIEFGAKVTAECDTGYQLYGNTRICQDNGWSDRHIECEVVKCTEPPNIENGAPEDPYDQYEYGQVVAYRCDKDFDMFGESTLTCLEDRAFHPSPPECLRVSCENPGISYATRIEGLPPYKLRSAVRYECNWGYKMNGSGSLVCQKHGWEPPPPSCTEVTCPKPSPVENGYYTPDKERYKYEERVTFSCRTGFRLEGASRIVCSKYETFETPPPRCVVVTCSAPPAINNGQFNDSSLKRYTYGQAVMYSCKEGFKLQGASTISCLENGHFRPPPKCVVTCPRPPVINNGQFEPVLERYDNGQAVTYSCIEGFRLKGDSTILCSEDGAFHPPPQCVNTCPRPHAIHYGHFKPLLEQYDYGQAVTYSCILGFRLNGASTVSCSEGGAFHPPPPQCDLHWITLCIFLGALILCVVIVVILCKRKQKNSGKVAVKTEEDGL